MTRSTRPSSRRRWAARSGAIVLAGTMAAAPLARAAEDPPDGLPAGPWILVPSVVIGVASSTNPFYRRADSDPGPETEWVSRVGPAIRGILPFRNSRLELRLDGSRTAYSKSETDRRWSLTGGGDVFFRLASGDEISVGAQRTSGVAEILKVLAASDAGIDPGGEAVYQGESYAYSSYSLSARRRLAGRRGWRVEILREDLDFDETTVNFFEFRGWQGAATYREPLSPALWITGTWRARRFDNFSALSGESYRDESSDDLLIGIEGTLGLRSPWVARAGRADHRFFGGQTSRKKTLCLDAQWEIGLGEATRLTVVATRRPYPSFFLDNDYYTNESAQVRMDWGGPRGFSVGSSVSFGRNDYDRPAPLVLPDQTIVQVYRRDRLARVDLYAKVPLGQRVGLVVAASHERRSSTYPGDYDVSQLFGGVGFGWF